MEETLQGIPISRGIGIGAPIFLIHLDAPVPEVEIQNSDIDNEIERYRKALESSRKDVELLQKLSEGPPEIASILGAHLEMMQDPLLTSVMEEKIRHMQRNTESIFHHIIEEYKVRFSSLQDQYFQERVRDIVDVSRRILGHLRPGESDQISRLTAQSVVLTHELVPSETVEARPDQVSAFVTMLGGPTAHAAIIARAKGIPYVAGIDIKSLRNQEIFCVIVDGTEGKVILNPAASTLKRYRKLHKQELEEDRKLKRTSHLKGETIDGVEVRLFANLENPADVSSLIRAGAEGVGLFRSEYLIFSKKNIPSEEEQFAIYRQMVKALKKRPLVIRIFDIGGDKRVEFPPTHPAARYFDEIGFEPNPALGCRAIRFLLRYPEILDAQLRAILRAACDGEIQILIPMVADVSELHAVKDRISEIICQLQKEKIKTVKAISVGCMIEVPSAAILSDSLAKEADFLSIGTNDLVQYVLASDRNHLRTSHLYTHPSILRLIEQIVASANRFKKPLIVCGECATNPLMVPLLIGLGVRAFSMAARHIPWVKQTIRSWKLADALRLASESV
jgi:phosphotransferase system enzyme I (PtsI)